MVSGPALCASARLVGLLQCVFAVGVDGGEGHIGEVLDSAHLNPSAVFSIAQGKIPVAANT